MNEIELRQVARLRAIPVAENGREVGARFEVETADGAIYVMAHRAYFNLYRALPAAGATLRHLNLGLEMVCKGTELAVSWPETTNGERRTTSEEPRPRPETVTEAVEQMVAKGKASKPGLAGRLDSAAELVLAGRVVLDGEGAKVSIYRVTDEGCECGDFRHRSGWCKHRLAARMARHLAANGFELPTEETALGGQESARLTTNGPTPQISAANLALIASGRVIDEERRSRQAYFRSEHGARTAALRMLANGATTLPADLARRAGIARDTRYEIRDTSGSVQADKEESQR